MWIGAESGHIWGNFNSKSGMMDIPIKAFVSQPTVKDVKDIIFPSLNDQGAHFISESASIHTKGVLAPQLDRIGKIIIRLGTQKTLFDYKATTVFNNGGGPANVFPFDAGFPVIRIMSLGPINHGAYWNDPWSFDIDHSFGGVHTLFEQFGLPSHSQPLEYGSKSEDACSNEQIPIVRRFIFLGLGYIGGFFVSLRGREYIDKNRRVIGSALWCIGFMGAVGGVGLMLATAWESTWCWWL